MTSYLIAFQLEGDSTRLIEAIKSYGIYSKVLENCWIIKTERTAVEIRNNLASFVSPNAKLMVLKSGKTAAWRNVFSSHDWLKNNI